MRAPESEPRERTVFNIHVPVHEGFARLKDGSAKALSADLLYDLVDAAEGEVLAKVGSRAFRGYRSLRLSVRRIRSARVEGEVDFFLARAKALLLAERGYASLPLKDVGRGRKERYLTIASEEREGGPAPAEGGVVIDIRNVLEGKVTRDSWSLGRAEAALFLSSLRSALATADALLLRKMEGG